MTECQSCRAEGRDKVEATRLVLNGPVRLPVCWYHALQAANSFLSVVSL